MPTLINGRIQYGAGEALPIQGTAEYGIAQSDPQYLMDFKQQNQGAAFDDLDLQGYNDLQEEESPVPVLSSTSGKTALNEYTTQHKNDLAQGEASTSTKGVAKNQPYDQTKDPKGGMQRVFNSKTGHSTFVAQGAQLGPDWLTAEEAAATGIQIPQEQTDDTGTPDYSQDERTIEESFAPQFAKYDKAYAKLAETTKELFAQRKLDEQQAAGRTKNATARYLKSAGFGGAGVQGVLSSIEREGLDRVKKLSLEEASLLADAEVALADKNYAVFADMRKEIAATRKERIDATKEVMKEALKIQEEQKKELQAEKKSINDVLLDAAKNNAPIEIQNAISQAQSLPDAVAAAGGWLQGGSGIVGEYTTYKRDAELRGLTPMSFDEYQTRDANRKVSLARAAINAGGLTPQENSTYLTITNKYQADAVINAAIKAGQINTLADQIIADPKSATNQLASLYIFVKNLDPESAVREGELSLANQTQSYLDKFSNSMTRLAEGRVLAPEAAKELALATKKLVATWEATAQKKTKLYKSQAGNSSPNVGTAFNKYLSDSEFMSDVGTENLETQEDAFAQLETFKDMNPDKVTEIGSRISQMESTLGRPISAEEFLQAFPEYTP